jgi:hypothetical protein
MDISSPAFFSSLQMAHAINVVRNSKSLLKVWPKVRFASPTTKASKMTALQQ